MPESTRVLVFGSSGSGKTSMLVELTGENRPVGDGVLGVTTFNTSPFNAVERNGKTYVFFDTAGLNESDAGKVPGKQALKGLVKLLRDSKDGYNLLVHVIRILPRNTDLWKKNHDFFVNVVADKKIPTLLVFTGCEDFDPMYQWLANNEQDLRKLGLRNNGAVCSCFHQPKASGGRAAMDKIYSSLRKESGSSVWKSIEKIALDVPYVIYKGESQFVVVLKKAVNWLARLVFPKKTVFEINAAVRQLLLAMGFTVDEAAHFAEKGEFPAEIEKS